MSYQIKLYDVDCIFLSYDEPNAEYNYADLLTKAPWAKRVHGVKGSDAAHKACAEISETEHFITVDGDNIVDEKFFDLTINFDDFDTGAESQLSWSGRNIINGLVYGNGGLKCWTRKHVLNMRTHEAAQDDTNQVDFCWDQAYHQMDGCYSLVQNNGSELQAWRAGFREGVKMSLLNGIKLSDPTNGNFKKLLPQQNYQRLMVWMSVGKDIKNGLHAVYGARLGCYLTNCTTWDYTQVKDFEYLNGLFLEQKQKFPDNHLLEKEIVEIGNKLRSELNIHFADFDEYSSKFYKETNVYLPRKHHRDDKSATFVTQVEPLAYYDAVFISNGEPYAEENYQRLLTKIPKDMTVHKVDKINGIYEAHKAAASLANTEMFFVIDADAWILDNFKFPATNDIEDTRYNYIFHSINPLNHLCYGYGAVKIFPKKSFAHAVDEIVDMTTTIGQGIKIINTVSNITRFNTDAYSTWRSAFRECVKLSSKIIKEQLDNETAYRLNCWISNASGEFAKECLAGAAAGKEYGERHADNYKELEKINNYIFIEDYYQKNYG